MSHISDAVREWAWSVGRDYPNAQWLLSSYDTWERNPHYRGPEQRHPEDYDFDDHEDVMCDLQFEEA